MLRSAALGQSVKAGEKVRPLKNAPRLCRSGQFSRPLLFQIQITKLVRAALGLLLWHLIWCFFVHSIAVPSLSSALSLFFCCFPGDQVRVLPRRKPDTSQKQAKSELGPGGKEGFFPLLSLISFSTLFICSLLHFPPSSHLLSLSLFFPLIELLSSAFFSGGGLSRSSWWGPREKRERGKRTFPDLWTSHSNGVLELSVLSYSSMDE